MGGGAAHGGGIFEEEEVRVLGFMWLRLMLATARNRVHLVLSGEKGGVVA